MPPKVTVNHPFTTTHKIL